MTTNNNISIQLTSGSSQFAGNNAMVLSLVNFSVRPSLRTFRP
jgi:hypothetical protein